MRKPSTWVWTRLGESAHHPKSDERTGGKRLLALLVAAVFVLIAAASYYTEGFVWALSQDATAGQRVDLIKAYFEQFGAWGPLAYLLAVTVEVVVAPIPGTALYLPGGAIFGWFVGGTMSLLGNVLGAGIACTLARYAFAGATITRNPRILALKRTIEKRGVLVIFLLRLNPLTSSDLVSYAAGTTAIGAAKVMAGTFLGMLPLCYVQAYFADELIRTFPWLIYVLIPVCVVYAAVAVILIARIRRPADIVEDAA